MKRILILAALIFCGEIFSQDTSSSNIFLSPGNIKSFADDLFCQKDYLRSINEYENYLKSSNDDTAKFKIALSYSYMGKHTQAAEKFKLIEKNSIFYKYAFAEYYKSEFILGDYNSLKIISENNTAAPDSATPGLKKLYLASLLLQEEKINISEKEFVGAFDGAEQPYAGKFYIEKMNPGYKKPLTAALLSAVVPGLGKMYAGEFSDGVFSALISGLLGYLTISNLEHQHWARAIIFSGAGAFFYFSNIYGSAAQAQIYNAKVDFNFNIDLKSFLAAKNYFVPKEPDFCK